MSRLFISESDRLSIIPFEFDSTLVLASVLISMAAGIAVLQQLALAARSSNAQFRTLMLLSNSVILAIGIWSMHFIGMLAVQICTTVSYDPKITLVSFLPAAGASYFALKQLSGSSLPPSRLLGSGVIIGSGIGLMHYVGMAAMQTSADIRYDFSLFLLSIVVAVGLAVLAVWVRFSVSRQREIDPPIRVFIGGSVLGAAIAGMHYTAMGAVRFVGVADGTTAASATDVALASTVGVIALGFVVTLLLANLLVRYLVTARELVRQRQRSEALNAAAADAVIWVSDLGIIEYANPAVTRTFGWSVDEMVGIPVERLVRLDSGNAATRLVDLMHQNRREARAVEAVGLHKDGEESPVRVAYGSIDVQGQVSYVVNLTDVSEQKHYEIALRQRDRRIATLLRNSPGVLFQCSRLAGDSLWVFDFISDSVLRLTGVSAQEILRDAYSFDALVHDDDRLRREMALGEVVAGQSYHVDYRIWGPAGQVIWLSETGIIGASEEGDLELIEGVLIDITELRLRKAETESLHEALHAGSVVLEFSTDGKILQANQACLALFGYTENELIGQHHSLLCFSEDVQSEGYWQHWDQLRGGIYKRGEYRRRHSAGHVIWLTASYSPLVDQEGKVIRIIKLMSDMTSHIEMERDLRAAKERAEAAATARSTFLSNMSHEIRTPLNAIMGFTDVLNETTVDEAQRRYLMTIKRSSKTLLQLLNDILDTAKLESEQLVFERGRVHLADVIQEVVSTYILLAERKGLVLEADLDPRLAPCYVGDELRIKQVITNLVSNAVKFTDTGSVRIEVQVAKPIGFCVKVVDTGIGIAPERIDRIFDKFAQADSSITRRFGGTGLGTSIARDLATGMGGRVDVESTEGRGSVFTVTLPLQPCEVDVVNPSGLLQTPGGSDPMTCKLQSLRILVADDVLENRELMQIHLHRLGHRVKLVANGAQALEVVTTEEFDVVLMDVHMPEMDGLESTRRIRLHEAQTGAVPVPIIALTASVLEQDRRTAIDAGMNGFALKPVDIDSLMQEVARVMHSSTPAPVVEFQTAVVTQPDSLAWHQAALDWGDALKHAQAAQRLVAEIQATLEASPQLPDAFLAHRWRGAALNLGLPLLAAQCARIESGEIEPSAATQARAQLLSLVESAVQHITATSFTPPEGMRPPVQQPLPDRDDLQKLRQKLRNGELDEALLSRVVRSLGSSAGQTLRNHVDEFDFEKALRALEDIATR